MASSVSLLGCLILACALNFANAQPLELEESVFKQLSAQDLRELELRQSPELLDFAARTGERVVIDITGPSQGGIVQSGVNAVLNCFPWLSRFSGGSIQWYIAMYVDLDHTMLGIAELQNRMTLNMPGSLRRIEGEFDEIFNITRVRIQGGAEDPHRGQYTCEVCTARGTEFELCHNATVTLPIAGRPPILNSTTGRIPDSSMDEEDQYRIGATICINIDDFDFMNNRPLTLVRLSCPNVEANAEDNIPPDVPTPNRTWTHTSLDGRTANLSSNAVRTRSVITDDFLMQFPLLGPMMAMNIFIVDTSGSQDTLIFRVFNLTRNDSRFNILQETFGTWTCTLSNALGTVEATTFFSDNCGTAFPSITRRPCPDVTDGLSVVTRGQTDPIPIGCNVCIAEARELWLTIECPTNVDSFPNRTVTYRWEDGNGNTLEGIDDGGTLLVQGPGTYRCNADFGDGEVDQASTNIRFIPDVQIRYLRNGYSTSGCSRLRTDMPFLSTDICAFIGEMIHISCETSQDGVTATPRPMANITASEANNDIQLFCDVTSENPDVNPNCNIGDLRLLVYGPARILTEAEITDIPCTGVAGNVYGPVSAPVAGATARLCCNAEGFPTPTVTWSRIVVNPVTGVASEEIVLVNSNISIITDDPVYVSVLEISNYMPGNDGTYVCRADNIAGIDSGNIAVTSSMRATEWAFSEWSECEPACVDGIRSRKVWCETTEGVVVADIMCNCDIRPDTIGNCSNVSLAQPPCYLTPLWKTGEFSRCTRGCRGGAKYRTVYCAIPLDGRRVEDRECTAVYGPYSRPLAYSICFNKCCVEDDYPRYCRSTGTGPCDDPIYQQYCCWTCGLTARP